MNTTLTIQEIKSYFPEFSEEGLLQLLARHGRVHRMPAGTTLLDYGDPMRMIPLVLEGSVKISRQSEEASELLLYYLVGGDSCAMTFDCCTTGRTSEIRAVTEEDSVLFGLPLHLFSDLMRFVSWQRFVLSAYSRRMNELIQTVDQVAFQQLDVRLMDYVRRRAALRQDESVTATHRDIANDLNVSREAVSRLLKLLEKRGDVRLGRNVIHLDSEVMQ